MNDIPFSPSLKHHLLMSVYAWCVECGHRPHIIVDTTVNSQHIHPLNRLTQFIKDNRIVFNVHDIAVENLFISDEVISFQARFSGVPLAISFPTSCVVSIFAKETGEGVSFPVVVEQNVTPDEAQSKPPIKHRPTLTIVN